MVGCFFCCNQASPWTSARNSPILLVPDLLCDENDKSVYKKLLQEIKNSGVEENGVWKLWHGDSHLIADDHLSWKESCPTFNSILEKVKK